MSVLAIAARELRSLFLSPLAWTVLAVVQAVLGYVFLAQLELYLQQQPRLGAGAPGFTEYVVAPLLRSAAIVLMLVVPLLTMRLLAEERRARTLSVLFSAPIAMYEIALGKYLGMLGFLGCVLALVALMPLSLLLGGTPDLGLLASGLLGLALLLAAFAAAGLFVSALTAQPSVAAVGTFGLLLLLWIVDWAGNAGIEGGGGLLARLSLLTHFDALLRGVFDTRDLVYYLLFVVLFLVLTVRRLEAERTRG